MNSSLCFSTFAPLANSFLCNRNIISTRRSNVHFSPSSRSRQVIRLVASPSKSVQYLPSDSTSLADIFRCPNCTTSLPPAPALRLSTLPSQCPNCSNEFPQQKYFVDLTKSAGPSLPQPLKLLRELRNNPSRQSLFQLPLISYVYEKGWRDSFSANGFPGIEKEFDLLLEFAPQGDIILDLSCGSALMARQLAKKPSYRRVIAADYSEAMLREAGEIAARDICVPEFDLVRADVNALPFQNGVFDTVSAGAALHCWPCIQDGLREVYRVLKPGGRFFATTFHKGAFSPITRFSNSSSPILKTVSDVLDSVQIRQPYRLFQNEEILYLFQASGFKEVDVKREKNFIAVRCVKAKN